jgi:micrococcal nuclease
MRRRATSTVAAAVSFALLLGGVAIAAELPPGGTFSDDDGNVHEAAIEAVAAAGITRGCNPPANYRFCPDDSITRGQMAAFLVRALDLPASSQDTFGDDDDSEFEADIEALVAAGITKGCDPPANTSFCPDDAVTRGQMAAFLRRAFSLAAGQPDAFGDDDGNVFEDDINALAASGITTGCTPSSFCPGDPVARDQMASFLTRALPLTPLPPPQAMMVQVASITDGDTIRVLIGGVNEPLRLIGIDTPEVGDDCAAEATEALKALVEDTTIRLDADVSDRDRFGRLLRYVFLADGTFVNERMVGDGWAYAIEYPPDTAWSDVLSAAETDARSEGLGLWSGDCGTPTDPTTTTTTPSSACDPAYPTVCIPSPPPDLNCGDIPHRRFEVLPPDPHGFDGDNDGIGCES